MKKNTERKSRKITRAKSVNKSLNHSLKFKNDKRSIERDNNFQEQGCFFKSFFESFIFL
jgi:hypothetical protein